MAEKTEHYEIWYTASDGAERHQKADTEDQALEIATEHTWNDFTNVTVYKVTTSVTSTVVNLDIPANPEPADVVVDAPPMQATV
jgi:hypothetical protein